MKLTEQLIIVASIAEVRTELKEAAARGLPSYEIDGIVTRLVTLYALIDTKALSEVLEVAVTPWRRAG
jgi:hypothetical protein